MMILVGDLPRLLSLAHALLAFKSTNLARDLPRSSFGEKFADFLLFLPRTSRRAGAGPSSLRRLLPPSLEVSPQIQHPV